MSLQFPNFLISKLLVNVHLFYQCGQALIYCFCLMDGQMEAESTILSGVQRKLIFHNKML